MDTIQEIGDRRLLAKFTAIMDLGFTGVTEKDQIFNRFTSLCVDRKFTVLLIVLAD